jgi:membrane protease YdiL (CAAX protease family)
MRFGLERAGVSCGPVLPALIVLALLTWHIAGRHAWRVSRETLSGMLAESLLFAFLLIVAGQLQSIAFDRIAGGTDVASTASVTASVARGSIGGAARAVTYLGAGIYEEFLFRLCLLPAAYGLFRLVKIPSGPAAGLAVLLTSLTFAAAHHVGPGGEPLAAFPFLFRTFAGLFFSALFVLRGFGVTVGCHAAYDLLVGLLLATA